MDEFWKNLASIITAVGSVIGALGVIIAVYLSYKSNQQSKTNAETLEVVKIQSDGQNTELNKLNKALGVAEGKEIATEKAEAKAADLISENTTEEDPVKVELVKKPKEKTL